MLARHVESRDCGPALKAAPSAFPMWLAQLSLPSEFSRTPFAGLNFFFLSSTLRLSKNPSLFLQGTLFSFRISFESPKKSPKKTRKTPLKKSQLSYLYPLPLCGVWKIFPQPPPSTFKVGSRPRDPSPFDSDQSAPTASSYWLFVD